MTPFIILIHIIAAAVWTGGHLVLAIGFLPKVLKNQDPAIIDFFESSFKRIGIPALLLQVITGFYLVYYYASDVSQWLNLVLNIGRVFMVKLSCLLVTILLAAHARFRVIPNLDKNNLRYLAVHIIAVTIVSVVFVIAGLNFRTGYFF